MDAGAGFTNLIAFMGARHVINDFHETNKTFLQNPLIKLLILISILYMNIKEPKLTIIIFFLYVLIVESSYEENCKVN
jgi:hypothetical protein